jgi:hypothetical protein
VKKLSEGILINTTNVEINLDFQLEFEKKIVCIPFLVENIYNTIDLISSQSLCLGQKKNISFSKLQTKNLELGLGREK